MQYNKFFFNCSKIFIALFAIYACNVFAGNKISKSDKNLDLLKLLQAVNNAAMYKNYKANVIIQKFDGAKVKTKTFFTEHYYDGTNEFEKIQPTQGQEFTIVRVNQMLQTYIPHKKQIITTKNEEVGFPALSNNLNILKYYTAEKLGQERTSSKLCDVILLKPKDNYRYNYKIWIYGNLLLKIQSIFNNKVIKDTMFVDIQDVYFNQAAINEWLNLGKEDWQHKISKMQPINLESLNFILPKNYKGYEYISSKKQHKKDNSYHIMYSDGLGNISIFIEQGTRFVSRINGYGTNLVSKQKSKYTITAVGQAPSNILEELLEQITTK